MLISLYEALRQGMPWDEKRQSDLKKKTVGPENTKEKTKQKIAI